MRRRVLAATAACAGLALGTAGPVHAASRNCDPIGGGACMLPFPTDWFTK